MGDAAERRVAKPRIRRRLRVIALGLVLLPTLALGVLIRAVAEADQQAVLRQAQERREQLQDRSEDLAIRLGARPDLFPAEPRERLSLRSAIAPVPLAAGIDVDGDCADWRAADLLETPLCETAGVRYDSAEFLAQPDEGYDPEDFSFEIFGGERDSYLFLFLRIRDQDLRIRRGGLEDSDQLRWVVSVPWGKGEFVSARFVTTFEAGGEVTTYQVGDTWVREVAPEERLAWGNYQLPAYRRPYGFWRPATGGYDAELRLPLATLGSRWREAKLGLAAVDVDAGSGRPNRKAMWVVPRTEGRFATQAPDAEVFRTVWGALDWNVHQREIAIFDARGRELVSTFSDAGPAPNDVNILVSTLFGALDGNDVASLTHDGGALAAARVVSDGGPLLGFILEGEPADDSRPRILTIVQESPVLAAMLGGTLLLLILLLGYTRRLSTRILALVEDVGVDRSADDEIGELSRRLSDLVERVRADRNYLERLPAILGHETLGPLGVVKMFLDDLEAEASPGPGKRYHAARRALRSIEDLIEDLREATSLEEALARGERSEVDLVDLVRDSVVAYAEANDAVLVADLPDGRLPLTVIEGRIEQLLDKLLDNAVEFSKGESVRIELREIGGGARIRVENTGSRLPEGAAAHRLFEPMWSERKRTSERHLGMGLYVARVIAEHHAGDIRAWNAPDDRVVFEIELRAA